jgi:hypothetical protein
VVTYNCLPSWSVRSANHHSISEIRAATWARSVGDTHLFTAEPYGGACRAQCPNSINFRNLWTRVWRGWGRKLISFGRILGHEHMLTAMTERLDGLSNLMR